MVIAPNILLIAAFIAWAGLMLTWAKYIREVTEHRRIKAVGQGEVPPDIRGTSNYERAALQESAHRALLVSPREKWSGRAMAFGIPPIILGVFFLNHPI